LLLFRTVRHPADTEPVRTVRLRDISTILRHNAQLIAMWSARWPPRSCSRS
jgi:hypothetical protein